MHGDTINFEHLSFERTEKNKFEQKIMRLLSVFLILISKVCFADIPYMPIHFTMKTDKQEYYEGETIKFTITLVNSDKQNTYPVLISANQNEGKKLV